jgi:hypothetical protein
MIKIGQLWRITVDPELYHSSLHLDDKFLIKSHGPGVLWNIVTSDGHIEWVGPEFVREHCVLEGACDCQAGPG